MNVTIYWKTKNEDTIRRIRERFCIEPYMSVNGETPTEIKDEDFPVLREVERRGFISIRFKPNK